ncbi:hypothetical protein AAIH37_35305, partial [Pseudomonas aeruginosa]|uniref:hypothetical protein n=1 Tax=Pseudomonas aeruginosa TaxID=287 RepID=UPI0031B7798E
LVGEDPLNTLGETIHQDLLGQLVNYFRVCKQLLVSCFIKTPRYLIINQLFLCRLGVASTGFAAFRISNFPEAVSSESPERHIGIVSASLGAKLF